MLYWIIQYSKDWLVTNKLLGSALSLNQFSRITIFFISSRAIILKVWNCLRTGKPSNLKSAETTYDLPQKPTKSIWLPKEFLTGAVAWGVLWKRCSYKFRKVHRTTPVPESLFLICLVSFFAGLRPPGDYSCIELKEQSCKLKKH